ncbi:hypothetical protein P7K49_029635 [Saguinus oedipus]|uniref:Uncharacterized protein n=1 Tax=Saguinus oedipus TaxID=9490 RepID=A0ABQ9U7U0_SAGOE|nr:hypothetical protein P7K49_029635 [Saguinus oedipus]
MTPVRIQHSLAGQTCTRPLIQTCGKRSPSSRWQMPDSACRRSLETTSAGGCCHPTPPDQRAALCPLSSPCNTPSGSSPFGDSWSWGAQLASLGGRGQGESPAWKVSLLRARELTPFSPTLPPATWPSRKLKSFPMCVSAKLEPEDDVEEGSGVSPGLYAALQHHRDSVWPENGVTEYGWETQPGLMGTQGTTLRCSTEVQARS